jgi:hypothetical protein
VSVLRLPFPVGNDITLRLIFRFAIDLETLSTCFGGGVNFGGGGISMSFSLSNFENSRLALLVRDLRSTVRLEYEPPSVITEARVRFRGGYDFGTSGAGGADKASNFAMRDVTFAATLRPNEGGRPTRTSGETIVRKICYYRNSKLNDTNDPSSEL